MKNQKPTIKKIIQRYKNAHNVDCKNCNRDEKSCVMKIYMSKNDKYVWFKYKVGEEDED